MWDFTFLNTFKDQLLQGFFMTLGVSIVALILSFFFGVVIAGLRMSRFWLFKTFSYYYIEFFRNTPLFILVCFFYYGNLFGLQSKFWIGTIPLALYTSAYIAEIVKAGIDSVPTGQFEAAKAYGLTYFQTMIFIVLPQAFRYILPALGSQFINLVKNSSILALIAGGDLLYFTEVISSEAAFLPVYVTTTLLYLLITVPLSRGVNFLERYFSLKPKSR
ncbi:MAG: hypothetical protein RLZ12_503 [Bacillota bacterium]|jgi:putative glutamine transport system permease protein